MMLILAVPFFGLPSPWPLISICVVTLVWVVLWLAGARPLVKTPLNIPVLIIALMILISTLVTYDLNISIGFVSGAVLGLVAYLTVARYATTPKGWWICFLLFGASNVLLAFAVALMVEWPQKIDLLAPITARLGGPLVKLPFFPRIPHPNLIPVFLLSVLPLLFAFTLYAVGQRTSWSRIYGTKRTLAIILCTIFLTLVSGAILLLSQSRGGYIAIAATALIMLMVWLPARGRWLVLIGVGITVLIAAAQFRSGSLATVREYSQELLTNDTAFSLDSMKGRIDLWKRAMYGIQDFPLTGMGMGTFGHVMPVLYPLPGVSEDGIPLNAHNTYLQAALDLGIPGLIALLWIQAGSLWMLVKSWKIVTKWQDDTADRMDLPSIKGTRMLTRPILLGMGGVYCAYLIFGMVESLGLGVSILNWMLTGLIFGFHFQIRSNQFEHDPTSVWAAPDQKNGKQLTEI